MAGKPVRKGQVAADARGYAAELLAKVGWQGRSGRRRLTTADRDRFIAYLVGEGWLSPTTLAYVGTGGRGYDVHPGAGVDPGPGKPSTPYALSDILSSNTWRTLASVAEYDQQRTMFQPVGGMDQIAKAFERQVGPVIRYSTEVEKIAQSPAGVEVFYRRSPEGAKGSVTGRLLPLRDPALGAERQIDVSRLRQVQGRHGRSVVLRAGRQVRPADEAPLRGGGRLHLRRPHLHRHAGDRLDLAALDRLAGRQGRDPRRYYSFSADAARISAMSPPDRAKFAQPIRRPEGASPPVYGELRDRVLRSLGDLAKYNLGGWAEWSPETRASAYPVLVEPDGRLYLAGEHLSYLGGWQAGAIESAWQQIGKIHQRALAA